MIKAGIKVLVLMPRDTTKASRMVDAAKSANIKVISYDRLVQNSDVDLFVSFDRLEIGWMQAEYLVKQVPRGNYVLIAGSPRDEGAKTLHDAQMSVLQRYINRGDIKVIADAYTKDWLPSEAYLFMLKAIDSAQGQIAAVLASNDGLAGGAIQALREHNLAGKVAVSGQDADLAAVICIAQGAQSMTVYKPIVNEAAIAAEEAVRLAKGEKAHAVGTMSNGKVKVPTIMLKPVVVTKDNIKTTVVKDGFQTTHPGPRSTVSAAGFARAMEAKERHASRLMLDDAVLGIGVGVSSENPSESVVVIYLEEGREHFPLPAELNGVRTEVVRTDAFRAFGWNEPALRDCSIK